MAALMRGNATCPDTDFEYFCGGQTSGRLPRKKEKLSAHAASSILFFPQKGEEPAELEEKARTISPLYEEAMNALQLHV